MRGAHGADGTRCADALPQPHDDGVQLQKALRSLHGQKKQVALREKALHPRFAAQKPHWCRGGHPLRVQSRLRQDRPLHLPQCVPGEKAPHRPPLPGQDGDAAQLSEPGRCGWPLPKREIMSSTSAASRRKRASTASSKPASCCRTFPSSSRAAAPWRICAKTAPCPT